MTNALTPAQENAQRFINDIADKALLHTPDVKKKLDLNYIKLLFRENAQMKPEYIIHFLHQAQLSGADPRTKQIFLTPRKKKIKNNGGPDQWETVGVTVYAYGFILGLVQRHPDYRGLETILTKKKRMRVGIKMNQYGKPDGVDLSKIEEVEEPCAVTTMYRGDRPYTYTAWLTDYFDAKSDKWVNSWDTMLLKCAETGAARHAFSDCVQGFYVPEEIESSFGEQVAEEQGRTLKEVENEAAIEHNASRMDAVMAKDGHFPEIDKIARDIADMSEVLTRGMDLVQKANWMEDNIGCTSFAEMKKGSLEFLKKTHEDIKAKLEASKFLQNTGALTTQKNTV